MTQNTPTQKDITINELAQEMRKGFVKLDKRIEDSVDELARSVASGFKEVDIRFSEIKEDIHNVEYRIDNLERTIIKDHGTRLRRVERKLQLA